MRKKLHVHCICLRTGPVLGTAQRVCALAKMLAGMLDQDAGWDAKLGAGWDIGPGCWLGYWTRMLVWGTELGVSWDTGPGCLAGMLD